MRVEVISAVPHSTVTCAALSRRANSVFVGSPYEVLPLENCFEPLPSTSSLSSCCNINCLELSTDERTLGVSTGTLLKVVDVVSGRESRNLSGHSLPITSIAAGKSSVYSWYTGSLDCSWSQWDTRMHPSKVLSARTAGAVRSVALSPGDRFVAVGSDSSIQLFDARQRAYVKQFNYSGRKLEFNPTEVLLSAVGNDRVVRFFCLETFELVSQSDAFVDDVQASVFDSHVMVATTSNSLQLLTWEPCDILASMPLRGIDRVVSVSMNGDEMDLLCIGETTERLEMRTYSIEEVLSCSPRADFGERVVEDFSPLDEEKNLSDEIELSHTTSSRDCSSAELRSNGSHEREEVSGSVDSGSAAESSQSSPASPARIPVSKNRASSQKPSRTRAATSSTTTASKVPPRAPSSAAAKSSAVRSVRPRPSPSLSDLNKERKSTSTLFAKHDSVSNLGSTQSLAAADREAKKRSASLKRSEISITYMGRPRTPSESDLSEDRRTNRNLGTRTTSRNAPETLTGNEKKKLVQRTSSPVGNSHRPTKIGSTPYVTPTSPAKKPVRSKPVRSNKSTDDSEYSLNSWDDLYVMMSKGHEQIMAASQQRLAESRELRNYVRMRGAQSLYSHEVSDSESLSRAAIRHFNEDREWSLNACRAFLPIVKENLLCDEEQLRNDALEALQQIALGATDKLQKFANAAASSRIGVDVAAEERAEKALFCIEELRELCTKRDWYYRQMNGEEIERLDAVLGLTKRL